MNMAGSLKPAKSGKRMKTLDVDGFLLTEVVYPPNAALPPLRSECATISFNVKGFSSECCEKTSFGCHLFELQLRPAGDAHPHRYGSMGAQSLLIEVKPQRLDKIRDISKFFDHTHLVRNCSTSAVAMRIYREFRLSDNSTPFIIEGLLLELLGLVMRDKQELIAADPPYWLIEAKEMIHEEYKGHLKLFEIAARVGVHPTRLAQMFRKHFGCTVGNYLRHLRLNHAVLELTSTDRPLAEIAVEAGFYDQSHFTHALKLYAGATPSSLRGTSCKRLDPPLGRKIKHPNLKGSS